MNPKYFIRLKWPNDCPLFPNNWLFWYKLKMNIIKPIHYASVDTFWAKIDRLFTQKLLLRNGGRSRIRLLHSYEVLWIYWCEPNCIMLPKKVLIIRSIGGRYVFGLRATQRNSSACVALRENMYLAFSVVNERGYIIFNGRHRNIFCIKSHVRRNINSKKNKLRFSALLAFSLFVGKWTICFSN